jgi:hypothetical protein
MEDFHARVFVRLTHRNLPNVHKYFWWTEQSVFYDRTTFLTSRLKSSNNNRGKYCLIFQVVGQLTLIPYASWGGELILNIYNRSVYPSKCVYSGLPLYYVLLKYCWNMIQFMIWRINCIGKDCLFSVSKKGLYLGVFPKSLTGGAIHVTAYASTPPPLHYM